MICSITILKLIRAPELFFAWTATTDKTVHFEFLDNDVPLGEDPKTIAYGCNNAMTVLDPVCLAGLIIIVK